jgi:deoxyribodipyrimidine photo-lyase
MTIDRSRIRTLKQGDDISGPVVYWMGRDQRARDNWALLHAQKLALKKRVPLIVVFCLVPEFPGATVRQYSFMLAALIETEKHLRKKHIAFFLLPGFPEDVLPAFLVRHKCSVLIADFDPLKIRRRWKEAVASGIAIPFYEVDAHNIVPCWVASGKQEYAAYTFRPKVRRLLPQYLTEFPSLKKHPFLFQGKHYATDRESIKTGPAADNSVSEIDWLLPGEKAAAKTLRDFIRRKLNFYSVRRNDPSSDFQSNLSPYIHFGHISAQRIALEIRKTKANKIDRDAFLEELIIRRELSDNYCFYNDNYDNCDGFPDWAKKTLESHRYDRREYLYSLDRFENSETHDKLWNAAQTEMVIRGKMHGYMRMYWAKKILEWTEAPEKAMEIAIYLNDRYELDGRDPNGYTGISWCIGGLHDRAWGERNIFGKIRYMSYNGCRGKFDIDSYVAHVRTLKHA